MNFRYCAAKPTQCPNHPEAPFNMCGCWGYRQYTTDPPPGAPRRVFLYPPQTLPLAPCQNAPIPAVPPNSLPPMPLMYSMAPTTSPYFAAPMPAYLPPGPSYGVPQMPFIYSAPVDANAPGQPESRVQHVMGSGGQPETIYRGKTRAEVKEDNDAERIRGAVQRNIDAENWAPRGDPEDLFEVWDLEGNRDFYSLATINSWDTEVGKWVWNANKTDCHFERRQ